MGAAPCWIFAILYVVLTNFARVLLRAGFISAPKVTLRFDIHAVASKLVSSCQCHSMSLCMRWTFNDAHSNVCRNFDLAVFNSSKNDKFNFWCIDGQKPNPGDYARVFMKLHGTSVRNRTAGSGWELSPLSLHVWQMHVRPGRIWNALHDCIMLAAATSRVLNVKRWLEINCLRFEGFCSLPAATQNLTPGGMDAMLGAGKIRWSEFWALWSDWSLQQYLIDSFWRCLNNVLLFAWASKHFWADFV